MAIMGGRSGGTAIDVPPPPISLLHAMSTILILPPIVRFSSYAPASSCCLELGAAVQGAVCHTHCNHGTGQRKRARKRATHEVEHRNVRMRWIAQCGLLCEEWGGVGWGGVGGGGGI